MTLPEKGVRGGLIEVFVDFEWRPYRRTRRDCSRSVSAASTRARSVTRILVSEPATTCRPLSPSGDSSVPVQELTTALHHVAVHAQALHPKFDSGHLTSQAVSVDRRSANLRGSDNGRDDRALPDAAARAV
jgi:hypothetical protein